MKSLADVVSGAGLAQYAEVALLIFFAVFVVVTLRVLATKKEALERASHLPLEHDDALSPSAPTTGGSTRGQQ